MPGRYQPEDPREWLNRARSNLELAKNSSSSDIYFEDLCYNAQQAAEKAIKAVFIHNHIPYPLVHDLAALITILINNHVDVPDRVRQSARLTRFAVATRYPGILAPVNEEEFRRAVRLAEEVVRWSERTVVMPRTE
jgi:HEPN domain-containing protein